MQTERICGSGSDTESEETQLEIVSRRELTPDENIWVDLRAEAIKQTPVKVSDSLTRLITLTTALAGGSIGVLKDDVCASWGRVVAATLFFAALLAAVIGSLPRTIALPLSPITDIKSAIRKAIGFKETCARVSLALLVAGMMAAILGVAIVAFSAKPIPSYIPQAM